MKPMKRAFTLFLLTAVLLDFQRAMPRTSFCCRTTLLIWALFACRKGIWAARYTTGSTMGGLQ